jgi:hypothetical protein
LQEPNDRTCIWCVLGFLFDQAHFFLKNVDNGPSNNLALPELAALPAPPASVDLPRFVVGRLFAVDWSAHVMQAWSLANA